jgi:hypothetical protein
VADTVSRRYSNRHGRGSFLRRLAGLEGEPTPVVLFTPDLGRDLCKPVSRETDTYRGLETFIRRQVARLPSPTVTAASHNGMTRSQSPESAQPPAELVRQIRELQAMRDLELLDQFEVSTLKMGILNRYYGVDHE